MKARFSTSRFFFTSSGWYVYMRKGDEKYQVHHFNNNIKSYDGGVLTVAGPFRSKRSLKNWLVGFLSFHSKSRDVPVEFIPDDVILSDNNSIYI